MKRFSFLLVATAVLALSVISVAFAGTSSGYIPWTSVGANAGTQPTPHKDFTLTTQKCGVCHAVHKANSSGELLLRGNVGDSCTYCHIDATALGYVRLYAGVGTNYSAGNAMAHGGVTPARCVDCHAVHAANTMTGSVSAKILKYGGWQDGLDLNASYDASSTTDRDGQVTLFCTRCHPYWTAASSGDINTSGKALWQDTNSDPDGPYSSHVMTNSGGDLTTYSGTNATYSNQVAWVESMHCRDCHGAGAANESLGLSTPAALTSNSNFPHYTAGAARFLNAAMYSTASSSGVGSQEASAQNDGACLRCHRGSATTGVGFDF